MTKAPIAFIIDGRTYSLRPTAGDAIRAMPAGDREQLLELLEAVREQERGSRAAVDAVVQRTRAVATGSGLAATSARPERLGSGDVDALMARLVMEEQRNRKPPLTRGSLYKWAGMGIVAVVLFVLIL